MFPVGPMVWTLTYRMDLKNTFWCSQCKPAHFCSLVAKRNQHGDGRNPRWRRTRGFKCPPREDVHSRCAARTDGRNRGPVVTSVVDQVHRGVRPAPGGGNKYALFLQISQKIPAAAGVGRWHNAYSTYPTCQQPHCGWKALDLWTGSRRVTPSRNVFSYLPFFNLLELGLFFGAKIRNVLWEENDIIYIYK